MRNLLLRDKKGVSEMVGYVLLIVIAVTLSALVYSFLRLYVPGESPKCQESINLIVKDYSCSNGQLNITLQNKGLFTVDGAYVRFGEAGQKVKPLDLTKVKSGVDTFTCILFNDPQPACRPIGLSSPLEPDKSVFRNYINLGITSGSREIEIEPVSLVKNKQVLCNQAIIDIPITCN